MDHRGQGAAVTPAPRQAGCSVKEWLEPMIESWVFQTRRAWSGSDGWPLRTVLARVMEEGAGASHSAPNQRVFEVYVNDGLAIRRAMDGMPILQRQVFAAHYLADGNATEKSQALGMSRARYWQVLDNAYFWIAGHMRSEE